MEQVEKLLKTFASPDAVFRRDFTVGKRAGVLLFQPELTDPEVLRAALVSCTESRRATLSALLQCVLFVAEAEMLPPCESEADRLLEGDALLFLEGESGCLVVNARKWDKRSVEEPPTETVVRGPREGFVEDYKTNITLLRKRLRTEKLVIEKHTVGRESRTTVGVAYVDGIADPDLVRDVCKRIDGLDIDAVADSHTLVPCLEQRPYSVFHQVGTSEKPDVTAAKMMNGRVAIIVDGSPIVLTLPYLMIENFHSAEDYYERSSFATFLRILRVFAVALAVFLPGLYVAALTYHYEVVPLKLLVTILNALKGIPLPPLLEILLILTLFEIIREASIRMPKSLGTAMSIVGALVLGDTAVKAGIISSPGVMVVALSSIALYTAPSLVGTSSLLRMLFTVIGGLGGLFGIMLAGTALVHYLAGINSLDTPYLAPFSPLLRNDLRDGIVKAPLYELCRRPQAVGSPNRTRLRTSDPARETGENA